MSSKVVQIWVSVPVKSGEETKYIYIRFTRSPEYARAFVTQCRKLGFRARYEHQFKGVKMSTPAQVRMGYAILRSAGYVGS